MSHWCLRCPSLHGEGIPFGKGQAITCDRDGAALCLHRADGQAGAPETGDEGLISPPDSPAGTSKGSYAMSPAWAQVAASEIEK